MPDFRSIWRYDIRRPPSGAIPRFPVWEVTAMIAVVYVGAIGLATPGSGRLTGLLGPIAAIVYALLLGGGVLALGGLALRAPNGLMVQLTGYGLLTTLSAAIGVGLAVDVGRIVYSGSTLFYVLMFGGTWRCAQLLNQLWRGSRQVCENPRYTGDGDR